jgi:hypothetical protein
MLCGATRTSAVETENQTVCQSSLINYITYSTVGVSSMDAVNVENLPVGMAWLWSGNQLTIVGEPTSAGTYVYTIKLCGMVVAATGTITVYDALVPGTITSGTTTICEGGTVSAITATAPTGGNGTYTYQWKQGAGNAAGTSNSAAYTPDGSYLSAPGTYRFTRVVTSCTSGTTTGTYTLVVHDLPAPPTNASSNTRCGTGDVTYSASTVTGCTIDWYDLANGGSSVSYGTASFTKNVNAGATTTYYAQSRNTTNGCISASRLPVTGIAYAVPTVTTTDAEADCGTGAVTLTANAGGGTTTANSYTWKVGASQAYTTTGNKYSTTVSNGSTTFSVSVTNAHHCVSSPSTGSIERCMGNRVNIPGIGEIGLLTTDAASESCGEVSWDVASAFCASFSARLPTLAELLAMCNYAYLIPSGMGCGYVWTSTIGDNNIASYVDTCYCTDWLYSVGHHLFVRCITD